MSAVRHELDGLVYLRHDLAFRRLDGGGVEILRSGSNGADRWTVAYELNPTEWVQVVAGVSAFADGRVAEVVMAMRAAEHLHMGKHQ